jgi:hypothetical protein
MSNPKDEITELNRIDFPFSLSEGLEVQRRQLEQWQRILTPAAFQLLHEESVKQNSVPNLDPASADGYDVWRGVDISNYVNNELINSDLL